MKSFSRRHYRSPLFCLNSRRGTANRSFVLWIGLSLLVLATGAYVFLSNSKEPPSVRKASAGNMCPTSLPKPIEQSPTNAIAKDRQSSEAEGTSDLWQKIQHTMQVERVHHSGDDRIEERSIARKDSSKVKRLLKELRGQGLRGEALYAAAEEQLVAAYGPGVLRMLDGYRRLEEEVAKEDLDAMTPEERFDYLHQARQVAFGEETAHMLFFKDEARDRYYFDERALREDPDLSEEMKEEGIRELRKKLRVDLASQGTSIQFADERLQALEEKLRERYGESVESMTPEERDQAVWDLYSEEMPPEIMQRIKEIKSSWAERAYGKQVLHSEEQGIY